MDNKILFFPVGRNAKVVSMTDEEMDELNSMPLDLEMPFFDNVVVMRSHNPKLPLNRIIFDEDGRALSKIHGDFFIVGIIDGAAAGLTPHQVKTYKDRHLKPTGLFNFGGHRCVFTYDPIMSSKPEDAENKNE